MHDDRAWDETFVVDDFWIGSGRGPAAIRARGQTLTASAVPLAGLPRRAITILPGVVDSHVHLGLVDRELLADGPLVEVHDLGWAPDEACAWRARPPSGVSIRIAGPFHTAPGGYPSGRSWAPPAAVRAVANPTDARAAVADAADRSLDMLKIALHAGMPLLDDRTLLTLVSAAHDAGLEAIVHAEGPGQVLRAIDAGADVLVHAPWTERVPDEVLARGVGMSWISTLAIHADSGRAIAVDNVRRFRALGGTVRYGTDMGNGPTPIGPSPAEILALEQAGLEGDDLIAAVVGPATETLRLDRTLACELPLPRSGAELITWIGSARRLEHYLSAEALAR